MDLLQDITYRGFLLNDSAFLTNYTGGGTTGTGMTGCIVESVDYSDVDVVQHTEKRSQQDGMEAGIPYLGIRRVRMAGTLYGTTRPALYDSLADLKAALSPVLAYRESPLDYGYLPLYFSVPTARTADYPSEVINLRMLAMPRAFQASFVRDLQGGDDTMPLAIAWQATFLCKDPSIQGQVYQEYDLVNGGSSPVAGNFDNRGNYVCPVNILLAVTSASGTITGSLGDSLFTITVPASTGSRTIRFKGEDKVITVEENNVEVPRMDILTFNGDTTWPLVPAGTSAYSLTFSASAMHGTGSLMWFYERYA